MIEEGRRRAQLDADCEAFKHWEAENGGTFSQFLDYKNRQ